MKVLDELLQRGCVDLEELQSVRVRGIFQVEKDLFFKAKYPISIYALAASHHEAIIEEETILLSIRQKRIIPIIMAPKFGAIIL